MKRLVFWRIRYVLLRNGTGAPCKRVARKAFFINKRPLGGYAFCGAGIALLRDVRELVFDEVTPARVIRVIPAGRENNVVSERKSGGCAVRGSYRAVCVKDAHCGEVVPEPLLCRLLNRPRQR